MSSTVNLFFLLLGPLLILLSDHFDPMLFWFIFLPERQSCSLAFDLMPNDTHTRPPSHSQLETILGSSLMNRNRIKRMILKRTNQMPGIITEQEDVVFKEVCYNKKAVPLTELPIQAYLTTTPIQKRKVPPHSPRSPSSLRKNTESFPQLYLGLPLPLVGCRITSSRKDRLKNDC